MTYNKILNETNEKKNLNLFNQAYQYLKNNDSMSLNTLLTNHTHEITHAFVQQLFFNSVSLGHIQTTEFLLNYGAKINEPMPLGDTAIMWAVLKQHTHLLPLLIKYGANVNAETIAGNTALTYALNQNMTAAINLLTQVGATLKNTIVNEESPKTPEDNLSFTKKRGS